MSAARPDSQSLFPSPAPLVFGIMGILILLAHLAASLDHSNWFWGFNHFYFLPRPVTVALIAAGCVLCLPPVWSLVFRLRGHLDFLHRRCPLNPLAGDLIPAAAFGLLFWLLRTPLHLLGDGQLLIRLLAEGIWAHPHEPLDRLIHFGILRLMGPRFGWDAPTVYAVTSVLAGVAYCFAALRLGRLLGQRIFVPAFLISLGTVQLFLGYAESYALATAMMLVYMLLALECLDGRRRLVWPGAALFAGVMLHNALCFLIPSFIYLFVFAGNGGGVRRVRSVLIGGVLLALMLAAVLASSLRWGQGEVSLALVPLSGTSIAQYTLFSWKHLVDFLNEQVLISPMAWIVALMFAVSYAGAPDIRRSHRYRFLLLAGLFSVLFTALLRPGLGGSRDWDLWSMGCLPYAVCAVSWVSLGMGRSDRFKYAACIVTVVGFVHVVPWIAVNRSADLGLQHFRSMLDDNPLWTGRRIAAALNELGSYHYGRGEFVEAEEEVGRAVEIAPDVARYWMSLGLVDIALGRRGRAELRFRRALELDPDFASAYNNLGGLLMEQGRLKEAERALRKALELEPGSAKSHINIGRIYKVRRDFNRAAGQFQRAVELQPEVAVNWYFLAEALEKIPGRNAEALEAWKEVTRLAGRDPSQQEMREAALKRIKADR